jgi:hypothetical protein
MRVVRRSRRMCEQKVQEIPVPAATTKSSAQRRDKRIFWMLALLIPPLAFCLALGGLSILQGFANRQWLIPALPTMTIVLTSLLLSFVFWGVPAWITATNFGFGSIDRPKLFCLKVAAFTTAVSLAYTLLGCLFVSLMVLDKVSVKYCVERSLLFIRALPPAAFGAALITCWLANTVAFRVDSPESNPPLSS